MTSRPLPKTIPPQNLTPQNSLPQEIQADLEAEEVWIPEPPPTDLIFDDGEPLESNRHRIGMNTLIASVHEALAPREDFFVGGNMFVYYSLDQIKNRDFRGPDVFVALDVDGRKERQGWVLWEEAGKYPDAIVELMSPSTAAVDLGKKKQIYEQTFRTRDYFVYDPFDVFSLKGWELKDRRFEPLEPNDRGWLWCESLGVWLGPWEGEILRETAPWLRLFDRQGNLILLPEERERQRAERESQRAERESQRAERESQRAERESQRAELERQEKERAIADLERERQARQALRLKLEEMGIDPDTLG
ncbi:MAG: Uma2 family endonuclease [Cyanobacteriota bacterium]|nr:Uma2 family endonuclease [Cyanobacteriota bacterium]